jgi:hypothetical protein
VSTPTTPAGAAQAFALAQVGHPTTPAGTGLGPGWPSLFHPSMHWHPWHKTFISIQLHFGVFLVVIKSSFKPGNHRYQSQHLEKSRVAIINTICSIHHFGDNILKEMPQNRLNQ